MELALFLVVVLVISISVYIELVTLQTQMYYVYDCIETANQILRNNWKLVLLYGIAAVIVTPITILSVVFCVREKWENKLYNSIKNNLYIKEKHDFLHTSRS